MNRTKGSIKNKVNISKLERVQSNNLISADSAWPVKKEKEFKTIYLKDVKASTMSMHIKIIVSVTLFSSIK